MNATHKTKSQNFNFQKGVAMVEYAMLLSSVAITAVVAIHRLGDNTAARYQDVGDSLTTSSSTSGASSSGTSGTSSSGTSGTSSAPTTPSLSKTISDGSGSNSTVKISWTAQSGVTYTVYSCAANSGTCTPDTSKNGITSTSPYSASANLNNDKNACYTVVATNAANLTSKATICAD